jgi:TorA maturation chaperone TorD
MKPTEEKEEISESVRTVMKKFKRDMTHLEQAYQSYQTASSDQTPIPKDHFSLFIDWALHMHEYYDEDLHSGQVDQQVILNNKTCHKASSRDQFFKSFSPELLNCLWPMRFTSKITHESLHFLNKIS